jgi:glutathione S-transferase
MGPRLRGDDGGESGVKIDRCAIARVRKHTLDARAWVLGPKPEDDRRWGDECVATLLMLTAAAHVSCLDYPGEGPRDDHPGVKEWFMRVKLRPALRAVLF